MEQRTFQDTEQSLDSSLDRVARVVPEIADKKEIIAQAVSEMLEQFDINKNILTDDAKVLVLSGLAEKWISEGKESQFVGDVLTLSAYENSSLLEEAFRNDQILTKEFELSEVEREAVYERYTNHKVTEQLKNKINEGLLADVKQRLGITAENEDDFELRVLNVAEDDMDFYGISAGNYPTYDADNREQYLKEVKEFDADAKELSNWKKGLIQRGSEFKKLLGESQIAAAWVDRSESGKSTLCLRLPAAEMILDKSITEKTSYFTDGDYRRVMATLEHEYTHTQGRVNITGESFLGIGLEEIRAEHFSGDTAGYSDAKGFLRDIKTITGFDIKDSLDSRPKGGTAAELYADIANGTSISDMVEILALAPMVYRPDSNTALDRLYATSEGYNGVHRRLLEKNVSLGKGTEIEHRVTNRANHLLSIGNLDTIGWIEKRWIVQEDLEVITSLVFDKAREIEAKK